jgi:hypothetical protein
MKYIDLPITAEEFNNNVKNGVFNLNDVWNFEYDLDLSQLPKIYTKNEKTWKVFNINNYFVVAVFYYKIGEIKEVDGGRLEEVYATNSLLEIIQENEIEFWNRSVKSRLYSSNQEQKERVYYHRYYNYIYVDVEFENLVSIVSDYFKNDIGLYPLDLNDRLITDKELKQIWDSDAHPNEQQFYASLYHSSDSSLSMDNEVGVSLINIHEQLYNFILNEYWDNGKLEDIDLSNKSIDHPIPDIIFENCTNIPHLIKISSSKSQFNLVYENLIFELLNKFDGNAFVLTPDLHIIGFKPNKYISLSEKKYYLYESTNDYFGDISLKNMELDILIEMEDYWELLHENSKKFLRTGYFLYKRSECGSAFLLDTSIASLTYSKCVENEMVQRIVMPFKKYFENNFNGCDMSLDLEDIHLKKMSLFLIGRDHTPPELGSFSYFLKNAINSKKRASWSVSIKAFRSFCETFESPDFVLNEELLFTMLSQIAKKYRNGGAHIKVLPLEYVTEFHNILFEQNFLKKLIKSTRPVIN